MKFATGLKPVSMELLIALALDYGLLHLLTGGDKPLIPGYRDDPYRLADNLTGTYLFDWEGRLLRDNITRRLLAIRLRLEIGEGEFAERCRQARDFCAGYLRQATNIMPNVWTIEYLFQSLQEYVADIQKAESRKEIRQAFFEGSLPRALQLLLENRRAREEWPALKQALEEDWEFRFTVNYFLREDVYNDEPYTHLEDCEAPESLRYFQWVDLFEESGWTRLVKAIQVGMERRT